MLSFNEAPPQVLFVTFSSMTPQKYKAYVVILNHERILTVQTIVLVLNFARILTFGFSVAYDFFCMNMI